MAKLSKTCEIFFLCEKKEKMKLKGLCHDQKRLHLFSHSEAYHEQMGPIPTSNGSLDIALSIAHS